LVDQNEGQIAKNASENV